MDYFHLQAAVGKRRIRLVVQQMEQQAGRKYIAVEQFVCLDIHQ
jgi:hypothetical protein